MKHLNLLLRNFIEYLVVTESEHVYKCGTAPMLGIVVGMVDLIVCIFAWLSVENNSKTNISTLMMGGSGRPKKFSESSIELQQAKHGDQVGQSKIDKFQ